jgi:hypothetical protein
MSEIDLLVWGIQEKDGMMHIDKSQNEHPLSSSFKRMKKKLLNKKSLS